MKLCGVRKTPAKILGGNILVQSKGDGLRGNDGMVLAPDTLKIESEGNGLYTANTGKNGRGSIEISNGEISIIAGGYGMVSKGDLIIRDCSINVKGVKEAWNIEGKSLVADGCVNNE